jgi:hypothetical protein
MIAMVLKRDLQALFISTGKVTDADRTKHLKILTQMVVKGKRTGRKKG